jgi:hypothetical protein
LGFAVLAEDFTHLPILPFEGFAVRHRNRRFALEILNARAPFIPVVIQAAREIV